MIAESILALPAKRRLALVLHEMAYRKRGRKLFTYFPETGPLRRELYQKHLEFFRAGRTHSIRAFMAGNRVGKTEGGGGFEVACHLTGRYPDWWEGAWFDCANHWWVAGDTAKTVRDIIQFKLLGRWGDFGTGLIPREDIIRFTAKAGVPEAVDTVTIRNKFKGESTLQFKSYDQGREAFQGTEQDGIWLDEEADEAIRGECVLRLMTTDGLLIETLTPLRGLTPLVMQYLPNGYEENGTMAVTDDKALIMAGWDDVPHLADGAKKKMLAETPPYLREARSKGIPSLGAGAIYPVPESEFVVDAFAIPGFWRRAYAMDVGWNRTAALWGALDADTDTLYLYSEHYRGQAEPPIHAEAIKAKGAWIPGVIDPASRGRSQDAGNVLNKLFSDLGLKLTPADNAVDAGLNDVWTRLSTGRLKVFSTLKNFIQEYRMYRRDEKGRIVKENDHLMDCMRYLVRSGIRVACVQPVAMPTHRDYMPLDAGLGM